MKNTLALIPLIICFSLLTGYNFMAAQWSAPTATAPGDNTAAPINVGSVTQAKSGNLAANIVAATTEMRSSRYCDALGNNCYLATDVTGDTNLPTCSNGQTLVADATGSWVCGSGTTAPTVSWLVNNQHSESQCTSLSGTIITEGGAKFCRFNAASCPSGWAQYQNWSARAGYNTGNICPALTFGNSCTFSTIAWSNSVKSETRSVQCDGTSDNDNRTVSCSARLSQIGCY